jgi:hypothetical protein
MAKHYRLFRQGEMKATPQVDGGGRSLVQVPYRIAIQTA